MNTRVTTKIKLARNGCTAAQMSLTASIEYVKFLLDHVASSLSLYCGVKVAIFEHLRTLVRHSYTA